MIVDVGFGMSAATLPTSQIRHRRPPQYKARFANAIATFGGIKGKKVIEKLKPFFNFAVKIV